MRQDLDETKPKQVYSPLSEDIFAHFLRKDVLVKAEEMTIRARFRGLERLRGSKSHRPTVLILSEGGRTLIVRAWHAIALLE